jgi:hypothetical protein
MTRHLLRGVAVLIAVAGLIDPASPVPGAARPRVALVAQGGSMPADRVRTRLAQNLGSAYDVVPFITSDAAAAIVIGDRYPDEHVTDVVPVATVTIPADASPATRIVRLDTPPAAPAGTLIRLVADIDGADLNGRTSDVTATIAGLEVGRASHRWTTGRERWHASVDVLPVGEPPWIVRLTTSTAGVPSTSNGIADALVDVRRAPFRVQVFEPRPSWATTFVRRALEADTRFDVASLSYSSRDTSTRTRGEVQLADPRLDNFDVVIVGGLERLSVADVRSLDRYLRERGGAVVLLPDARPTAAPMKDLLRLEMTERLLDQPVMLAGSSPSLRASELLVLRSSLPATDVIASAPGAETSPVIITVPHGEGRVLVSGAMDAWRFRANDDSAFDRFWQSTIAGLALAAPPPLSVSVTPSVLTAGRRADVVVRARAHDATTIAAAIGDRAIRLTPAAERGVFQGSFVAAGAGQSRVSATAEGPNPQSASRAIVVQTDASASLAASAPLSLLSSSHHGIDVAPDALPAVEAFVRRTATAPPATVVTRPMRSPWWILPFAACLSVEWWLRRRRGLR